MGGKARPPSWRAEPAPRWSDVHISRTFDYQHIFFRCGHLAPVALHRSPGTAVHLRRQQPWDSATGGPGKAACFSSDLHGDTMNTVRFRYGFHPEGMDPLFALRHGARTLPSSPSSTVRAAPAPVHVPAVVPGRSHRSVRAPEPRPRRVGAYFLTAAMLGAAIGVWALAFGPSGPSDEASEPLLAWAPPVTLEPDPLPSPVVHESHPDVRSTVSQPASRPELPTASRPATASRETPPPAGPAVDPGPPASPPPVPAPAVSTSRPTLPALTVPETSSPRVTPERVKPAVLPGLSPADVAHRDARAGADASNPEAVAKPRAPVPDRPTTPQPKTRLTVPRVSR
jgi:hypothetical protein